MTNDQAVLLATMIWGGFKLLGLTNVLAALIIALAMLYTRRH